MVNKSIDEVADIFLREFKHITYRTDSYPFTLQHYWLPKWVNNAGLIMHYFAILLLKIIKSNPCPKWSRDSPKTYKTKPKCISGFIIHLVKGFGWWFVDLGFKFWFINAAFYGWLDWKVVKKTKNDFRRPRKLDVILVLHSSALHSKIWSKARIFFNSIADTPPSKHQSLSNCNLLPIQAYQT